MLLYSIGLELTILLAFWLALGVWQRDPSTAGRTTFVALAGSAGLWCGGELLLQRGIVDEVVADRIRYLGILGLPPLWLGVAAHSARLELARRVRWFPLVLLTPSSVLYALFFFGGGWSSVFMTTLPGRQDLYGPLWWVAAAYGYALVLAGSLIFLVSAAWAPRPGPWGRRIAVGIAALAPLSANAAYIANGMTWALDPTPLLFGLALLALQSAILRGGLLEASPISQHDLIEQLPLGLILTDRHGVVIGMNPAAEQRLELDERRAMGRTLDAILTEAGRDVRADVSPVFSGENEVGQLVLLDPPDKAD